MRLDHIAYRVKNRQEAIDFFKNAFGYKIQSSFEIDLEDGSKAECMALDPPEKGSGTHVSSMSIHGGPVFADGVDVDYHMAPEIFVSDGPPGGLIWNWVTKWCPGRGGGIHHLAYEVSDVRKTMEEWVSKGHLFTTKTPLSCDDLIQCFSEPNPYTGVIYEFIERKGAHGFCEANVAKLMNSTAHLNQKKENLP